MWAQVCKLAEQYAKLFPYFIQLGYVVDKMEASCFMCGRHQKVYGLGNPWKAKN